MILRNQSSREQTVSDGANLKTVAPAGLVFVSNETGFALLSADPKVWTSEQPLIPPAPS